MKMQFYILPQFSYYNYQSFTTRAQTIFSVQHKNSDGISEEVKKQMKALFEKAITIDVNIFTQYIIKQPIKADKSKIFCFYSTTLEIIDLISSNANKKWDNKSRTKQSSNNLKCSSPKKLLDSEQMKGKSPNQKPLKFFDVIQKLKLKELLPSGAFDQCLEEIRQEVRAQTENRMLKFLKKQEDQNQTLYLHIFFTYYIKNYYVYVMCKKYVHIMSSQNIKSRKHILCYQLYEVLPQKQKQRQLWEIRCVTYQLMTNKILFKGKSEILSLILIHNFVGSNITVKDNGKTNDTNQLINFLSIYKFNKYIIMIIMQYKFIVIHLNQKL